MPGEIVIASGPFTVTLEFARQRRTTFRASVVHDGNGCQAGKNVVYAIPGGWQSACALGVSGDWVFYVKYRSLNVTAVGEPGPGRFSDVPGNQTTCDTVNIINTGCDTLVIDGISGCGNAPFSVDTTLTAHSIPPGGSTSIERVRDAHRAAQPATATVTVKSNAANGPLTIAVSVDGVTAVGPPRVE